MTDSIYAAYRRELRTSIARSLRLGPSRQENEESFNSFVPLWTLIHGLRDSSNAPNPTKAMLLSFLRESGDLTSFIKLSRDHHIERNFGKELQQAHQATLFTSYFDELISDSLLFVNAFHLNNYRGCLIALRCMLEDLYRHLYYKDNREDFIRIHELGHSEHQLKLTPAFFREYLTTVSYLTVLKGLSWNFSLFGQSVNGIQNLNSQLYAKTSAFVHGSSPSTLNGFTSNLDVVYESSRANNVLILSKLFTLLSVSFLCCAHLDQFSRFNESTKRIALGAFNNFQRPQFRKIVEV